jgi:hypothetical protein
MPLVLFWRRFKPVFHKGKNRIQELQSELLAANSHFIKRITQGSMMVRVGSLESASHNPDL